MEQVSIVYPMPNDHQNEIDRVNKACYDNCADIWDRFPFPEAIPKFVQKYYTPNLGNNVLDVGSGTGILAKWLLDQGFNVLCLDPSSEMVRRCQEKGLRTQQGSLQDYRSKDQFGMIFAILSLIHIPKTAFSSQIKKLADSLSPGGILFLAMLEGQGEGFFEGQKYPRFLSFYSTDEVKEKIKPFFMQMDYHYAKAGGIGYMLFVLKKP